MEGLPYPQTSPPSELIPSVGLKIPPSPKPQKQNLGCFFCLFLEFVTLIAGGLHSRQTKKKNTQRKYGNMWKIQGFEKAIFAVQDSNIYLLVCQGTYFEAPNEQNVVHFVRLTVKR